jgi:hypothetical protein
MRKYRIKVFGTATAAIALITLLTYESAPLNKYEAEGRAFRERVINEFKTKAAINFTTITDLAPICKAENFEEMPLLQVKSIFMAAGAKTLDDVSTLPNHVRKENDFDYIGSFDVGSSLFGTEIFSMSFSVQNINGILMVKEIKNCAVISNYL